MAVTAIVYDDEEVTELILACLIHFHLSHTRDLTDALDLAPHTWPQVPFTGRSAPPQGPYRISRSGSMPWPVERHLLLVFLYSFPDL